MLTDEIWLKIGTQYDLNLERKSLDFDRESLAGQSSAALEFNDKGKG